MLSDDEVIATLRTQQCTLLSTQRAGQQLWRWTGPDVPANWWPSRRDAIDAMRGALQW